MSNSPLVNYTKISPNKTKNRNHAIDTITIHCVVGQVSVETLGNIFQTKQASSNYGIGLDGRVGMYVEEKDRSWCSSNAANDHRAITIECASDMKEPYAIKPVVYNKLLDLVTDICKRNGIKKLVWSTSKSDRVNHKNGCNMTCHRDYANKSCPGTYIYDREGQIAAEVNRRLNGDTPQPTPTPGGTCEVEVQVLKPNVTTGECVKTAQRLLKELGFKDQYGSVLKIDGDYGSRSVYAMKNFQKSKGLAVDGWCGPDTWNRLLNG
ncbi:MAG: N-acetylmuramoyl-L-alanine amidase [Methanobrevibacter sp.]|nr:N-acetylmuramoyl-L-alanine amidase [Methanobrevibacter sp.]